MTRSPPVPPTAQTLPHAPARPAAARTPSRAARRPRTPARLHPTAATPFYIQ